MYNNKGKSVFEFLNYKEYLRQLVGSRRQKSGVRSQFARALGCQPTYLSQILYSNPDLSLEQSELLSNFLGHTEIEKQYFILLVQRERAGTLSLRNFFDNQIQKLVESRFDLTKRLGGKTVLSQENQSIYYSSWHYAAIHIGLTIPNLRSMNGLAEAFQISKRRVGAVLEFLCQSGLAKEHEGFFIPTEKQIRIGRSSHNIFKHHSHWRQQAIEALEREAISDLHYSGVVSLSDTDVRKLKDRLLEVIDEFVNVVSSSKEEKLYCFNIDFFDLVRSEIKTGLSCKI
jgi:uncharacterized protein (TIGR02147 family)